MSKKEELYDLQRALPTTGLFWLRFIACRLSSRSHRSRVYWPISVKFCLWLPEEQGKPWSPKLEKWDNWELRSQRGANFVASFFFNFNVHFAGHCAPTGRTKSTFIPKLLITSASKFARNSQGCICIHMLSFIRLLQILLILCDRETYFWAGPRTFNWCKSSQSCVYFSSI